MTVGKVFLVGAGPGDLGLITFKGHQILGKADVILYDHLSPRELLRLAKPDAELISVGKFASQHTLPQEGINDLLVEKAKQGHMVCRLKGGDCYMFGRGGEEALACVEAGIEFEVVPGITSALAAPCYAGIPPTHRDCTPDIAFVTGHRKAPTTTEADDDWNIDIPKAGTIVFFMSVGNIARIIRSLIQQGWADDTPIAAIEHGTCYDQRVIVGKLNDFLARAEQAKLRKPALFIVGEVVSLHDQLDWFGKKKNVLVLGNHPDRYARLGNVVHRRIIDCVGLEDTTRIDAMLDRMPDNDWIVFTSVNAAKFLFDRVFAQGKDARILGTVKIAAIGKSTAARLREYGLQADLIPDNESSTGLLEAFSKLDIRGKRILLPRAEIASEELPRGLDVMGAIIETLVVYKTVDMEPDEVDFDYIDQILFTSGSTVRAFVKYFGQVPDHVKVLCLGQPTLNTAKAHGIQGDIIPS
ncbi:MAG: uroporphyrinogen-III C-methyltransferase [Phycisphaerae bacterium]|nr:uroporphyrinogen-III C-methyltransferase [Phycisphaerae bacterium]